MGEEEKKKTDKKDDGVPAADLSKLTTEELVSLATELRDKNKKLEQERAETQKKNAEESAKIIKNFLQGDKPDNAGGEEDPHFEKFLNRNNNL